MPFCQLSVNNVESSHTVIDNIFITQFMPDAPPRFTEVYLYGLMLCSAPPSNNNIDTICNALNLTRTDVRTAFDYWEELGLVIVTGDEDFKVIYQRIQTNIGLLKKIKPGKYLSFNKAMQKVLSDRMISPNEYNEYYMFLETTAFEPEALVAVANYSCELKGKDISANYILTVARNLAHSGVKTLAAVEETLKSRGKYTDDIRLILKSLGSVRKIDHTDQSLYEKWTKDMGYTLDAIIYVAKTVKYGGMNGLDSLLEEYYRHHLFSPAEISNYTKSKSELFDTAKQINAAIGVYYQNVSVVVEEYIVPWLSKGYDRDTLLLLANYCFKNSIRTLEGMNEVVEKFYKLGLITPEAIHQYITAILADDKIIKKILDTLGLSRRVNRNDRINYKIWTREWGMDDELILYAADKARGKDNPMSYLSRVLSDFKSKDVTRLSQLAAITDKKSAATTTTANFKQREYTQEELKAVFDNLTDIEV